MALLGGVLVLGALYTLIGLGQAAAHDSITSFLFPWAVSLGNIGLLGFWSMMIFLGVLTVGFVYEWRKGALEWE